MSRLGKAIARPRPGDPAPNRSLIGQTGLVTAGTFVQGLARFAYPVLIGNLMPTGTVGKVQSAISMAMLLSQLWPTSAANAASKYIGLARGAQAPADAEHATRYLIRTMVWAALALAVLAVPIGWSVIDLPVGLLVTAPLLVVAFAGYTFTRGIQFGSGKAAGAAILDMLSAIVSIGLLGLALAGRIEWALLVPLTAGYALYTVLAWPRLGQAAPRDAAAGAHREREIASFVRWGAISSLAASGVLQLTMMLTNLVDTTIMVDQYAAAITVATPTAMLVGALYQVLFPSITSAHSAGADEQVVARVDAATRALVVALTTLLGMVAVAAGPIIAILYPARDWPQAPLLLRMLAIAVLLSNLGAPSVIFIAGTTSRGIRQIALINVVALVAALGVGMALAQPLGAQGLAMGATAGGFVVSAGPVVKAWHRASMAWAGLAYRFAVGLTLIGAFALLDQLVDLGWWQIAVAMAFALIYLAISMPDLRRIAAVSPVVRRVMPWLAAAE